MSRSIDRAAIDQVLRRGVDSGAVPHVAAIAADADSVFYAAGFGPRVAGQNDEVGADTEFAGVQVLDGFDGDKPRLREPATGPTSATS